MWLTVETKFHPESTRVRISSYFVRFGTQQVPFQDYALHSTLTGVVFVKRWICVGGTEKWTQTITRRHRIVMHSPKKKYTKPNTRTLKLTWNNTYVHISIHPKRRLVVVGREMWHLSLWWVICENEAACFDGLIVCYIVFRAFGYFSRSEIYVLCVEKISTYITPSSSCTLHKSSFACFAKYLYRLKRNSSIRRWTKVWW